MRLAGALVGLCVLLQACAGGAPVPTVGATTAPEQESTTTGPLEPVSSAEATVTQTVVTSAGGGEITAVPGLKGFAGRLEVMDADPIEVLDTVLADAASRMGLTLDKVRLKQVEPETWSDASLGCPQANEAYAQTRVSGSRVVIDADGDLLDYRIRQDGSFTLCGS